MFKQSFPTSQFATDTRNNKESNEKMNKNKNFISQDLHRPRNQQQQQESNIKVTPFPHQSLGNPEHQFQNLNLPTRRVPWSPPPPRLHHGYPQHSRYGLNQLNRDFPQQSVLLQGIFFPLRQSDGNVLLNTQLMAPPLHRLQYQGLGGNNPNSLNNLNAAAGYRRSQQFQPNNFLSQNRQQQRPLLPDHRRVLQNHQPLSRYVT